jgi:osmotically-inducible protein OsmY
MLTTQIPRINPEEFSRCEESTQMADHGKTRSPGQNRDAAIKSSIEHAIWNDDVLCAIEYHEIDVQVKNGIVYLYGHITGTSSKSRIENAIRSIPGILGFQNHLVLDDKLTLDVAGSLGDLEHRYDCKFFTGASHGVISLNGNVSDENVKLLAEQRAASHPNVRGVMNNIRVAGAEKELQNQPFLQPTIGENIYFLDGISGVVKQVVINPNNRRVVGMTVQGQFAEMQQDVKSSNSANGQSPEQLIVLSIDVVRYLTQVSGFLNINSTERTGYITFDSTSFRTPNVEWTPPHPYCPDDVLLPVEQREVEYQILEQLPRPPLVVAMPEQALWEQLLANPGLGG